MDRFGKSVLVRSWSRRVAARLKTNHEEQKDLELVDTLSPIKRRLFSSLTNNFDPVGLQEALTNNAEYKWFLKRSKARIPTLLALLKSEASEMSGVSKGSEVSEVEDDDVDTILQGQVLEFLATLSSSISSSARLPSLEDLRRRLSSQNLMKSAATKDCALIIIFSMIGWLTMLYEPRTGQTPQVVPALMLELKDAKGKVLTSDVYHKNSISLTEDVTSQLPLHHVFAQFGEFIPRQARADTNIRVDVFQEQLVVSYLNFQTLYEVAEIRIAWVDCLSLHLDFDEKTRYLKVFRFPSFCKLLCLARKDQTQTPGQVSAPFLALLFTELLQMSTRTNRDPTRATQQTGPDFYREVLLTYRLLFGQEKKSWKTWKRYCAHEVGLFDAETRDPLLPILCGKTWQGESTYDGIEAPDIGQQYSARVDFPFFGERLVKVQQFVLKKNPSDWRSLWNDRRDFLRFYTFWAVVIVGSASLVLSLLQNIEGAIQIAYSAKGAA